MRPTGNYILIRQSKNTEWYYVLRGANHHAFDTSETYTQRGTAIRAARKAHPGASVYEWANGAHQLALVP